QRRIGGIGIAIHGGAERVVGHPALPPFLRQHCPDGDRPEPALWAYSHNGLLPPGSLGKVTLPHCTYVSCTGSRAQCRRVGASRSSVSCRPSALRRGCVPWGFTWRRSPRGHRLTRVCQTAYTRTGGGPCCATISASWRRGAV